MSSSDYLSAGLQDLRLKPRLLRALTRDLDPTPDLQLCSLLDKLKIHGLLTETSVQKLEPKVLDEWRVAVDAWAERLVGMVGDKMPQRRWAGTCLMGVTIEECSASRIVSSYSVWFEKLLHNIQDSSNTRFVNEATCAALSDLFTRIASFSQVKKEATSFAGRVEGAVDLLCTLIKFYPFSVHRYYEKVESALASKILSVDCNLELLKKYASALALLPHVKHDSDYWSLMMQKILININSLLNDALQGLEQEGKGVEIMKLLVPAGKDPPGPLGGQSQTENGNLNLNLNLNFKATKRLGEYILPLVSSLTYSCGIMLTNPYPSQVTIPIKVILSLIHRVLNTDGSLVTKSVLPSTTVLYQELLCAELPALHLTFLDLLIGVIKGLRSQILPHASSVVRLVMDYFTRADLPAVRAKVYNALELLLNSMGVGMSLYLAEPLVSNALNDLNEGQESNNATKSGHNEILPKISPKKRKRVRGSNQTEEMNIETEIVSDRKTGRIDVKIAALKAIETLLSVGGGVKAETWRLDIDHLILTISTNAFYTLFNNNNNKVRNASFEESESSQVEFTLAALKALLASLLSPCHARPSCLSQGIQLFQKGKLETGTAVALFCEKALLSLEVLIHPRDLPFTESNFAGSAFTAFQNPCSTNELENENEEEMYCGWNNSSDDDEKKEEMEGPVGDETGEKISEKMEMDVEMTTNVLGEKEEDNNKSNDNDNDNNRGVDDLSIEGEKNELNNVNEDLNLGLKSKEVMLYDSDSESLGSIPDIVEADPDSD
ncbi:hypothetical protein LUZ60_012665 [Juncus effusus]|nr:hypothetical protein LUZ60_012665 [Juncus effusus]